MPGTLHYHLLLANTDLINRKPAISAAGKPGFQQYTPVLDLEHLLYGRPLTEMPAEVSTTLYTGASSPIVAVRACLLALQKAGVPVVIHVYDLGIGQPYSLPCQDPHWHRPDFEVHFAPFPGDIEPHTYFFFLNEMDTSEDDCQEAYVTIHGHYFLNTVLLSSLDDTHLVAECVPGGTTSANVLLNLLEGRLLATPSSANDTDTASARSKIVEQLTKVSATYIDRWTRAHDPLTFGPALCRELEHRLCDGFQRFILDILRRSPPTGLTDRRIILGGGLQMFAPWYWVHATRYACAQRGYHSNVDIITTPFVWHDHGVQQLNPVGRFRHFRSCDPRAARIFQDANEGYRTYAEGFAKEGCGLGAVLDITPILHPEGYIGLMSALEESIDA